MRTKLRSLQPLIIRGTSRWDPPSFIRIGIFLAFLISLPLVAIPTRASNPSNSSLIGFSLSTDPDATNVEAGKSTSVTVIVSSQGLNGPVNLSVAVSSSSGPSATFSPSTVLVLPGGVANSTMSIDATTAQPGVYNIDLTGSSLLEPSQVTTVVANVTTAASSPPVNLPSGSTPPTESYPPSGSSSSGNSGSNNGQTSTTTSGQTPRGSIGPNGRDSSPTSDPLALLVAGNLLAAIATVAALGSLHRRRK
jgi:hypothetical protein